MERKSIVLHSIPGRIRLQSSIVSEVNNCNTIEEIIRAFTGIQNVIIEPVTESILIYYDKDVINSKDALNYIHLFQILMDNEFSVTVKKSNEFQSKIVNIIKFLVQVDKKLHIHSYLYEYLKSTSNLVELLVKRKRTSNN